jgi:hypothetical protein
LRVRSTLTTRPKASVWLTGGEIVWVLSKCVLCPSNSTRIDPVALVWLLKTEFVRRQMLRHSIGIAYPAIAEASCRELVLPITGENLGALSKRARALAEAQERLEMARSALLADVHEIDWSAVHWV